MTKCAIPGSATVVRVSIETGEPTNPSLRGSVSAIPRAPTAASAFPIAPKDALNSLGGFDSHGQGPPRRGIEYYKGVSCDAWAPTCIFKIAGYLSSSTDGRWIENDDRVLCAKFRHANVAGCQYEHHARCRSTAKRASAFIATGHSGSAYERISAREGHQGQNCP